MENKLNFFITLIKSTGEIILQEGSLISIKIPKQWQKPDPNINNPALWVCHLPNNSMGINFVSLYPSELIVKKHGNTYRGRLEPNGSNDGEEFHRCELLLSKDNQEQQSNWALILIIIFLIVAIAIFAINSQRSTRELF